MVLQLNGHVEPLAQAHVASCWSYSSDRCRRLPRSAISRALCVASFQAKPHTDATATAMHSTIPPLPAAVIAVVNALVLQRGRGREVRRRPAIPGHVAAAPGRRRAVVPVVLPGRDVTVRLIVHGCVLVQDVRPRHRNARLAILVPRRRRRAILLRQGKTHRRLLRPTPSILAGGWRGGRNHIGGPHRAPPRPFPSSTKSR